MIFRYHIETFSRDNEEETELRLRELGLERWDMISVLPGTRTDPTDVHHFTAFFSRDAGEEIGL